MKDTEVFEPVVSPGQVETVAALAAGLVFSSRVDAAKLAEKAMADTYGVTDTMLSTFFSRTVTETVVPASPWIRFAPS